jgi:integrase
VGAEVGTSLDALTVATFLADAADPAGLNWGKQSLLGALSALRAHCVETPGLTNDFDSTPADRSLVTRAITGALRHPDRSQAEARTRHPLTAAHLALLFAKGAALQSPALLRVVKAVALVGLVCGARIGELLVRAQQAPVTLAASDVISTPTYYKLNLRGAKTDKHKTGQTLLVTKTTTVSPARPGATAEPISAFDALKEYYDARAPDQEGGPATPRPRAFFESETGLPLTAAAFSKALRILLTANGDNADHYAPHSLRRGMATSLAEQGEASSTEVDVFGRWSSSRSKQTYTQLSAARTRTLQESILKTSNTFTAFHGRN